jgi:AcrR family transcriptional regulator
MATAACAVSTPVAWAAHLDAVAPDAYADLLPDILLQPDTRPSLWGRQQKRRARLFSQTRIRIAEHGCDSVCVRDLARTCGLSPQTVYSLAGDRDALMALAVDQHQNAMLAAARNLRIEHSLGFFMGLADIFWRCATKNPAYTRNLVKDYFASAGSVYQAVRKRTLEALNNELRTLQENGRLRDGLSLPLIADQMLALLSVATLDWGWHSGATPLRKQLVSAIGFLLLGATRRTEAASIEQWIEAAKS